VVRGQKTAIGGGANVRLGGYKKTLNGRLSGFDLGPNIRL